MILRTALMACAAACLVQVASWASAPVQPVSRDPAVLRQEGRMVYAPGHEGRLPGPAGTRVVTSLLDVASPMRYGEFVWLDEHVPPGRVWVRVDLTRQTISVFRGGNEIGTAVVLFGADGKPTPRGVFPVLERDRDHRSSLYDAEMPYTLRLTSDGVAIHASDVRSGSATHGCIGVPLQFAELLFDQVHKGDVVEIV